MMMFMDSLPLLTGGIDFDFSVADNPLGVDSLHMFATWSELLQATHE